MATFCTTDDIKIGAYTLRRFVGLFGTIHTDVFKNGKLIGDMKDGYVRYFGESSRWLSVTRAQAFRWWGHAERASGRALSIHDFPSFMWDAVSMREDEEAVRCLDDWRYARWSVIKRG